MYRGLGKRILDIIIAVAGLVILAIPMMVIAILILCTSKGPVLFRQQRYGRYKKLFTLYKFRTMSTKAPQNIPTNNFANADQYITPLGSVLRKLSLDELPQLFNVIRGEMSIVGPRPVIEIERNLIKLRQLYHANSVRPGITGWAQVNGRDDLDDVSKAKLDGQYVKRMSFFFDVKIILKTIGAVLTIAGNTEGSERSQLRMDDVSE